MSSAPTSATMKAQQWAQALKNCSCLMHRSAPFDAPSGWKAAAENVGRGYSLQGVHDTFVASAAHRANLLTRRHTHIATGVAMASDGEFFVVQAFYDLT